MAGEPKLSARAMDVDSITDVVTLRSLMKAQLERTAALEKRLGMNDGGSGGGMKDRSIPILPSKSAAVFPSFPQNDVEEIDHTCVGFLIVDAYTSMMHFTLMVVAQCMGLIYAWKRTRGAAAHMTRGALAILHVRVLKKPGTDCNTPSCCRQAEKVETLEQLVISLRRKLQVRTEQVILAPLKAVHA
jgi:hypothetical protein